MIDWTPTRTRIGLAAAGVAAVLGCTVMVCRHLDERVAPAGVGLQAVLTWGTAVVTSAALVGCGVAAPRTASRLAAACGITGIAFATWVTTTIWPNRWASWIGLVCVPVFRIAIVLAVLEWPVGRLDPSWRRPVRIWVAVWVAVLVITPFVGSAREIPWGRSDWLLPAIGGEAIGLVREAITGLLVGVAPAVLLVALSRRRQRLPIGLRDRTTPALMAAWVFAVGDFWLVWSNVIARDLEFAREGPTMLATARSMVDYARFGVAAVVLTVAARATAERRDCGERDEGGHQIASIDVGAATVPFTRFALTHARPDGTWVDSEGAVASEPDGDALVVADPDGSALAALAGARTSGDPHAVRAAVAAVAADASRRRRAAEAAAAELVLRSVRRQVVEQHDASRRRLERNLHDGAQRQLVGLIIELGLIDRGGGRALSGAERSAVADRIETVASSVDGLVLDPRPAVLELGLAAALTTLGAACPVPCEVRCHGDLSADDPLAVALWYLASDAIANALKHAHPASIDVRLRVDATDVVLRIADDGRGGVGALPASLRARAEDAGAVASIEPAEGGGTIVLVTGPRSRV